MDIYVDNEFRNDLRNNQEIELDCNQKPKLMISGSIFTKNLEIDLSSLEDETVTIYLEYIFGWWMNGIRAFIVGNDNRFIGTYTT